MHKPLLAQIIKVFSHAVLTALAALAFASANQDLAASTDDALLEPKPAPSSEGAVTKALTDTLPVYAIGRPGPPRALSPEQPPLPAAPTTARSPFSGPLEASSVAVHLASYHNEQDAERGWDILAASYPELLDGYRPAMRYVDLGDRGVFVRLLATPVNSMAAAEDLCAAFRETGAYCSPADEDGTLLPFEDDSA